nr:hypothetical protein [Clostridia bacterium]
MCRHIWQNVGKVRVCPRCGLTVSLIDGKVMLDNELHGTLNRNRGKTK